MCIRDRLERESHCRPRVVRACTDHTRTRAHTYTHTYTGRGQLDRSRGGGACRLVWEELEEHAARL
eukprot:2860987-Prymnesium_polylepis.1